MNPGVAPSLPVVGLSLSPAPDPRSCISMGVVEVHVVLLFCGAGD